MTKVDHSDSRRALIIGGSLGGLFAGNLLRRIGWDVEIFERSAKDLDSRGSGIVLQPEVVEVFRRAGVDLRSVELGVRSGYRIVLRPDGSIQSKHFAPQTQTSWSLVYTTLKAAFGERRYHQAKTLVRIDQDPRGGTVTAQLEDGYMRDGRSMLVGADGGNSTVRQQFWPTMRPTYAGYLAWRGLLPEDHMSRAAREMLHHGDFVFANNKGSHFLGYLVPGEQNDVRPSHRFYNWVWYRVADEHMLGDIMSDRNGDSARLCGPRRFAGRSVGQPSPSRRGDPASTSLSRGRRGDDTSLRSGYSRSRLRPPGLWTCRHHRRRCRAPATPYRRQHLQGRR